MQKHPLDSLNEEYAEYCEECLNANETPWSFAQWFETVYYYEMRNLMPTGELHSGVDDFYANTHL